MEIKLIIFDLDGTLIDSRIDITNAINYALEPYGIGTFTVDEITRMVGKGITTLIEDILRPHPDIKKEKVLKRFLEHYESHLVDNTMAYPGVYGTLERLYRWRKAVVSNKREYLSKSILRALDLEKFFDIVVGSDTTPEKKPSPLPIDFVLDKLDITRSETVMVGDSEIDIKTARVSGVKVISVTYGYRPRGVLNGADYIIDDITELPALIESISLFSHR